MVATNIQLNTTACTTFNADGCRERSGSRTECALLEFVQGLSPTLQDAQAVVLQVGGQGSRQAAGPSCNAAHRIHAQHMLVLTVAEALVSPL